METVTVEKLRAFGNIAKAIEWAQEQYGERPKRPTKPILKNGATSAEARIFADTLEGYEKDNFEFDKKLKAYCASKKTIDEDIEIFISEESGLRKIPSQYRNKVFALAWEDGHSSGYYEVYYRLQKLVGIFN